MNMITVDTRYANFGVIYDTQTGVVLKTAPIAQWCIGKNIRYVIKYYKNKKNAKIYYHDEERNID